ncbi:MAG: carboxypeptidase regulatory-like domain-containing protein [Gemmatimonadales bacterium]|nr:carboxypeptidase regulatory-like domain-containing protein [Candidatus Palauibacter denitrificans]
MTGDPSSPARIREAFEYAHIGAALAASFALALPGPAVAAQQPGARLTGILVSESDGAPLDGAVVSLDGPDGVAVWETLSTASGAFSLPRPRLRVRTASECRASATIRGPPARSASTPRRRSALYASRSRCGRYRSRS